MFNWLRELYDIRYAARARRLELDLAYQESKRVSYEENEILCDSCETLKMQLAIANQEKKELLDRILHVPKVIEQVQSEVFKPILPKNHLSFNTHRQMLEKADKERAKLIKQNEIDNKKIESNQASTKQASEMSVEDLERELGVEEIK